MKPSIGRIVHFHTQGAPDPAPAIVTAVWSDVCVNLTIFPDYGLPYCRSSVVNEHEGASEWWSWPPRVEGRGA